MANPSEAERRAALMDEMRAKIRELEALHMKAQADTNIIGAKVEEAKAIYRRTFGEEYGYDG